MPSLSLRTIRSDCHSSSPVSASSANANSTVAPYTRPSATATPFGPTVGESYVFSHLTSPLSRSIAWTFEFRSWVKTVPSMMIGVEA
jgi:hypothetical protein